MLLKKSDTRRTITVVGASGYVGRNVVKALIADNYHVVALSRSDPNIDGAEWKRFDVLNYDDVKAANLEGQIVINCASSNQDGNGPANRMEVNYKGATALAAATAGGKLIHISSSSVYSMRPSDSPIVEDSYSFHRNHTLNTYSHTKSLAEHLLSHSSWGGTKIVSLRPHGIYGRDDTTLMPHIMKKVRWVRRGVKGFIVLPNQGLALHSLTHIDNLVEAVKLAVIYQPSDAFTAFNISDSGAVRLRDAIEAYIKTQFPSLTALKFNGLSAESFMRIAAKFPSKLSQYEIAQVGYDRILDISKAENLLGFKPERFKVV